MNNAVEIIIIIYQYYNKWPNKLNNFQQSNKTRQNELYLFLKVYLKQLSLMKVQQVQLYHIKQFILNFILYITDNSLQKEPKS